jgi:hypothetical protein
MGICSVPRNHEASSLGASDPAANQRSEFSNARVPTVGEVSKHSSRPAYASILQFLIFITTSIYNATPTENPQKGLFLKKAHCAFGIAQEPHIGISPACGSGLDLQPHATGQDEDLSTKKAPPVSQRCFAAAFVVNGDGRMLNERDV